MEGMFHLQRKENGVIGIIGIQVTSSLKIFMMVKN
jgi:hypothetical protein